MRTSSSPVLVDAVPVSAAIGAFGVIYGATASTVIGPGMTVASSLLLFSGAAQFTMVGLIDAGATPTAILLAVTVLGLRHLPLAAVVLPRLRVNRPRRALLALGLTDETAGLAVASRRPAARTMAMVGVAAYSAWIAGTVAGVLGADLVAAAPLAGVVFVILFVGLSALTCREGADAWRAVAAAAVTTTLLVAVPSAGALGAILVGVGCAATVTRGRDPARSAPARGARSEGDDPAGDDPARDGAVHPGALRDGRP
ncbi:MAG TPA: AzlC family ABC transporter permease [Euzebyales bacterium]|nr:AzlC family ABC transporter permease [Euzebyales bacterium]